LTDFNIVGIFNYIKANQNLFKKVGLSPTA